MNDATTTDEGGGTPAFDGIRVLDLTRGIAGPTATMLLADLGAEVVKVEPPGGEAAAGQPGYLYRNRNKRLTTLDLDSAHDLGELRRLLRAADVAVFDDVPGALERRGLDAVTVRADHPGLVHLWMPPYGTRGRWSQLPADDHLLAAVSGVADYHHATEDRPVVPATPVLLHCQGLLGAAAAAGALVGRQATGVGDAVVVSGLHAVAAMMAAVFCDAAGKPPPAKTAGGSMPHYRAYRCADGRWLYLGCLTRAFFLSALEVMDRLDVMLLPGVDGEFANLLQPAVGATVIASLEPTFASRPQAAWLRDFDAAGVPHAPVWRRDEWFDSEVVRQGGLRTTMDGPGGVPVELPGLALTLSETPGRLRHLPTDDHRAAAAGLWTDAVPPPERTDHLAAAPGGRHRLPLEGVRVLELSSFVAGTFGPSILRQQGAHVVKVEPLSGDPYRLFTASFAAVHQGKEGITLDLKHPDGVPLLFELARHADVVVDNLRPGAAHRLGIDLDALRTVNPAVITCSVTAFGTRGPLRDKPGFDPLLQAMSGLMATQGGDDAPVVEQMLVHDIATGSLVAFGTLAALHARGRSGRGQAVATSLAHLTLLLQSDAFVRLPGRAPAPVGGRDHAGPTATHRLHPCADGWIAMAAIGAAEARRALDALEVPGRDGIDDAELAAPARDGDLAARITATLQGLERTDALDRLGATGVPAASVLGRMAVMSDGWLADNGFFHDVDDPVIGAVKAVRGYADWPAEDRCGAVRPRSPGLGADTRAVLEAAGVAPERIDALVAAGVVSDPT